MDVEIILKRGLTHTAATAAVAKVCFGLGGLSGLLFHTRGGDSVGAGLAVVIASFLLQPIREGSQGRLDHFFYRDLLDYRRTLIEFCTTLTNEVRVDPMLSWQMDRVS